MQVKLNAKSILKTLAYHGIPNHDMERTNKNPRHINLKSRDGKIQAGTKSKQCGITALQDGKTGDSFSILRKKSASEQGTVMSRHGQKQNNKYRAANRIKISSRTTQQD